MATGSTGSVVAGGKFGQDASAVDPATGLDFFVLVQGFSLHLHEVEG